MKKLLQVLGLYVFPTFQYLSKYVAQIYRAQYGAAMLDCWKIVQTLEVTLAI